MTAAEIVSKLCDANGFSVTTERIAKAKALAARSKIDWSAVLAVMTPEQRATMMEGDA